MILVVKLQLIIYIFLFVGQMYVNLEKMSKSLRNSVLISDFLKDHTSNHFRMFCFKKHYNDPLHYAKDVFQSCENDCKRIVQFLADAESYTKGTWSLGDVSESALLQVNYFNTLKLYNSKINIFLTGIYLSFSGVRDNQERIQRKLSGRF